jgi:RNA polymerase sigma-70 factor (ECF subfamily)
MVEKKNTEDVNLLDRLRHSEEAALNLLYKKYWKFLFLSAYNILQDQQVCEDIIQEIFIKLWDKREQIQIRVSLKSYLYASARYEVFRQIRTGSVREDIFDQLQERLQTSPEYGSLEHKELIFQIDSVVNVLPEKCRQVYKLSREEQLSHKEIASQLHISTKTVENHLNKALRQLRNALGLLSLLIGLLEF